MYLYGTNLGGTKGKLVRMHISTIEVDAESYRQWLTMIVVVNIMGTLLSKLLLDTTALYLSDALKKKLNYKADITQSRVNLLTARLNDKKHRRLKGSDGKPPNSSL